MERIDKYVYINLAERPDRKEHILKDLKKYNVPDEKIIRIDAVKSDKGAYGCAMSHLKAMEAFRDSGDEVWWILEDDNYFCQCKDVIDYYVNLFLDNPDFDALLGTYCAIKGTDLPGGIFRRAKESCLANCFIVKKRVCEALIASHKQSARTLNPKFGKTGGTPCDFMWYHVMKIFYFVAPYRPLGSQLVNYSNIKNKVMNYKKRTGANKIQVNEDSKIES